MAIRGEAMRAGAEAKRERLGPIGLERVGLEEATWGLVAAMAVATLAWIAAAGLTPDRGWLTTPALVAALLGAGLFVVRVVWPDEKLATLLASMLHLLLFTLFAGCLQYLVAGLKLPLQDATFHAWDSRLGLDWRAYLAFVDAHPRLAGTLTLAYGSLIPQVALACAGLGLLGRLAELRAFTFAFILSGLACVAVSGVVPAMTVYAHLGLGPADHPHLVPALAQAHVAHLGAVRGGALASVPPGSVEGIVAFPSFHATLGVLLVAAFWRVPGLRWPALIVNAALVAATPLLGGHYFVDVIAGLALGVAALALAYRLSKREKRSAWERFGDSPGNIAGAISIRSEAALAMASPRVAEYRKDSTAARSAK